MPKVERDAELLDATRKAVRTHGGNKAAAARELGVSRLFMSRFLRSGRAIESSRQRLRRGLEERGYVSPPAPTAVSLNTEMIQESHIVKQALRYLLHAVEAYEQVSTHPSGLCPKSFMKLL